MEKPATSILAVDDEETLLQLLTHVLKRQGYYVDTAPDGRTAITMLQTLPFDLVFLDIMMPDVGGIEVLKFIKDQHLDTEVIMITAVHNVKTAVECMSLGAFYYVTKPYVAAELLGLVDRALERKRLVVQNKAFRRQIAYRALPSSMVGKDKALLEMLDLALRAAPTESTVLIQGASGTGKDVVANFIHANSLRKEQPSLVLNCSSLPETQLESELFGHEKGAFADANNAKQGLLEIANGGTLFLDEIGEMPLTVQPKLLRFLQTGEFRRAGGSKNLKSDVRIISATNKDLRREVTARRFSEDLLLQLNVITLQLPALRERKDDIPLLADQFLRDYAGFKQPKHLDDKALEVLVNYGWPGNTRELENVIRRAAVLSEDDVICVDHLGLPPRSRTTRKSTSGIRSKGIRVGTSISLAELQKAHVKSVLASVNWNKRRAAKILGIDVKALSGKIKTYKLSKTK
ncbi:MAG: sigma-54 dependent transcriptional regulator [Ignavibacteria bacterium]|nr:sigma-54 dependent transcriptional regulator [Ignavibacteria bacterium]